MPAKIDLIIPNKVIVRDGFRKFEVVETTLFRLEVQGTEQYRFFTNNDEVLDAIADPNGRVLHCKALKVGKCEIQLQRPDRTVDTHLMVDVFAGEATVLEVSSVDREPLQNNPPAAAVI